MIVASPHCGLRLGSRLGGEVYERRLLELLPAHGWECRIGLPRARPVEPVEGWSVDLLLPPRGLRWYIAPSAFVPWLVGLLRRGEADLLRGHSIRFTGPSLLAARRLTGADVPIVLHHLHTDPEWARLEAPILRRADHVITISSASREALLDAGVDERRITVVPPGVEVAPAEGDLAEAWPEAGLRLLFFGRLEPRKRPDWALRAFAQVRERADASLVVAGDGSLREAMGELAAQLGVADRVRFLADVDSARRDRLFASADLLLFPSAREGFGFVAAEAHGQGLPVIATRGQGMDEIVVDGVTGRLVAGAPGDFAAAALELHAAGALGRMGEAARERAAGLTWDRSARDVAAVYDALTASGRAAAAGSA